MKFLDPSLLFYTSDTHFRHKAILRYQPNRNYENVDAMNEALINNWNAVVPTNGIVIHHGDFAFASKNQIRRFREQLNGHIILIRGNHDYKSEVIDVFGRENLHQSLVIYVNGQTVHCSHHPMASWEDAEDGGWHTHGHYHGHTVDHNDGHYKRKDVGIDTHERQCPYSHAELKAIMDTRLVVPQRHPE